MGNITQGVDWFELPFGVVFNTYVSYRHRARELNQLYFNSNGPSAGAELDFGDIVLGYSYYEERFPKLQETSYNNEYYLTGYYSWRPVTRSGHYLPGGIWFNGSYDLNGLNGSGLMGWINQGWSLYSFRNQGEVVAYAEYSYRSRTKNQKYYDAQGPVVGIEYRQGPVTIGLDYYWETLPKLKEHSNRAQLYIGIYEFWDLKY